MNEEEAKEWLNDIKEQIYNKRYECITENTVKKVIGIMKKFENNEIIERLGTHTLEIMTRSSDMAVHYITNAHGGIECLMKLFKKNAEKRRGYLVLFFPHFKPNPFLVYYDLRHILFRIAACKETQTKLMKSEYLSPIFERLSNEQDPYSILYSSILLSRLLDLSEGSFPDNITKNMIESKILKRLPLLSTDNVPSMHPQCYSWYLEKIINGTKAQKYVCACIAVSATAWSFYEQQLIDDGAIPILKRVLSDENTDSFVKKLSYYNRYSYFQL